MSSSLTVPKDTSGHFMYIGSYADLSEVPDPSLGDVVSIAGTDITYVYIDEWTEFGSTESISATPSVELPSRPIRTNCPRCGGPLGSLTERQLSLGVIACEFCGCSISIWDFEL